MTPLEPGPAGGAYRFRDQPSSAPKSAPVSYHQTVTKVDPRAAVLGVFAAFDSAHTGRVAVEDFKRGLHYLGVSKHHTPKVRGTDIREMWCSSQ